MIKHIVMWRLKDQAQGQDRHGNALLIKQRLESLSGKIPGLNKIEVGIDISTTPESSDLALCCEFADQAALKGYEQNPQHQSLLSFVQGVRIERRIIDYEILA